MRAIVDPLQKEQIVNVPFPVPNGPGGSGADFLSTMVQQYRADDHQVSVASLSMMMNQLRGVEIWVSRRHGDRAPNGRVLRRRHPS
jgi:putative tricarboxylic transport membrane protein